MGGGQVPVVCHDLSGRPLTPAGLYGTGHRYQTELDKWEREDAACDLVFIGDRNLRFALPGWIGAFKTPTAWHGAQAPASATTRLGLGRLLAAC